MAFPDVICSKIAFEIDGNIWSLQKGKLSEAACDFNGKGIPNAQRILPISKAALIVLSYGGLLHARGKTISI